MNLGIGHGVLFAVDVNSLSEDEVDRLIGMAWEDRTPFEAIEDQFGLKENQVRALMRRHLRTNEAQARNPGPTRHNP